MIAQMVTPIGKRTGPFINKRGVASNTAAAVLLSSTLAMRGMIYGQTTGPKVRVDGVAGTAALVVQTQHASLPLNTIARLAISIGRRHGLQAK